MADSIASGVRRLGGAFRSDVSTIRVSGWSPFNAVVDRRSHPFTRDGTAPVV